MLVFEACFSGSNSPGSALKGRKERSQNHAIEHVTANNTTGRDSFAQAIEYDLKVPSDEATFEEATAVITSASQKKGRVAFQQEPSAGREESESQEGVASPSAVILKQPEKSGMSCSVSALVTSPHFPCKVAQDAEPCGSSGSARSSSTRDDNPDPDDSNDYSRVSSKDCSLNDVSNASVSFRGKVDEVQSVCDYIIAANVFVHALQSERGCRSDDSSAGYALSLVLLSLHQHGASATAISCIMHLSNLLCVMQFDVRG